MVEEFLRISKFFGRQHLKNLKGYGLPKQWIKNGPVDIYWRQSLKDLKGYCLPKADHIPSNFLKVFHKIYLVHSWIFCLDWRYEKM